MRTGYESSVDADDERAIFVALIVVRLIGQFISEFCGVAHATSVVMSGGAKSPALEGEWLSPFSDTAAARCTGVATIACYVAVSGA